MHQYSPLIRPADISDAAALAVLAERTFRDAFAANTDTLTLVVEHNPRAIAFYQKYGFETVGDQIFEVGSDPQRDLIMARQLGA